MGRDKIQNLKTVGVLILIAVGLFGCSYLSEMPKYNWAERIDGQMNELPMFARMEAYKGVDIASPATWVWPHEQPVYVMPDPDDSAGFYVTSFDYESGDPTEAYVTHREVDCESGFEMISSPGDEGGAIRRNILGDAVRAPDGRTYRYLNNAPQRLDDKERQWFCDRDWSEERSRL